MLQEIFHAEISQRGSEEHRGLQAAAYLFQVKFFRSAVQKLQILLQFFVRRLSDHFFCIRKRDLLRIQFMLAGICGEKLCDLSCGPVADTLKAFSGADGPGNRTGPDAEDIFDFIHQFEGVIDLPVHFINKCEDRNMAHHADLE